MHTVLLQSYPPLLIQTVQQLYTPCCFLLCFLSVWDLGHCKLFCTSKGVTRNMMAW